MFVYGGVPRYGDDLLTVHVMGRLDARGKTAERLFQFLPSVDIHSEIAAHIDHDMRVFRKERHLSVNIAFQIGKAVNDFANGFFGFQNFK